MTALLWLESPSSITSLQVITLSIHWCSFQYQSSQSKTHTIHSDINVCYRCQIGKKVKVPILVYISSVRGQSWSRTLGSQPAGDSMHSHGAGGGLPPPPTRPTATHTHSHKPGGRLLLLSDRPAVTFPAVWHHRPQASTKLYCLVTLAPHIGVRNLPRVFTP